MSSILKYKSTSKAYWYKQGSRFVLKDMITGS